MRAALDRLVRYNRLVHSAAEFTVQEAGARVRIEHAFAVPGRQPGRQASEFTLATLVAITGQIAGVDIRPLAVELPHAPPADDLTAYEAVFGVPPRMRRPVGAVELARSDLDRPCPAADPHLSEVILRQANALLAARPGPSTTYGDRVRRYLVDHLGGNAVSLASAAESLKLSERSLQRRLAAEDTSFDALVDELRRELALRYLADRSMAIGEVAYLLGYSEPSAFHRAFKRWTGSTPAEIRAG
ncbi:MAG: AraC family transcriptional regulator [Kofleriaceae bacterium]|nr:MAG: AraC family transcriptional regulator [Kofleriaceae bacterium]